MRPDSMSDAASKGSSSCINEQTGTLMGQLGEREHAAPFHMQADVCRSHYEGPPPPPYKTCKRRQA